MFHIANRPHICHLLVEYLSAAFLAFQVVIGSFAWIVWQSDGVGNIYVIVDVYVYVYVCIPCTHGHT